MKNDASPLLASLRRRFRGDSWRRSLQGEEHKCLALAVGDAAYPVTREVVAALVGPVEAEKPTPLLAVENPKHRVHRTTLVRKLFEVERHDSKNGGWNLPQDNSSGKSGEPSGIAPYSETLPFESSFEFDWKGG